MHEQNGKFSRELETIKRKQTETLELKYTMTKENRTEKLNGELQKIHCAEERIYGLEDRMS